MAEKFDEGLLFDHSSRRVFALSIGEGDGFGHTFGGPVRHRGAIPEGGAFPLHLIFNLNTTDPRCPIKLSNAQWLPLYYPFAYLGDLAYRVLSDTEIKLLPYFNCIDADSVDPKFPRSNQALEIPTRPVRIASTNWDTATPEDAYWWSPIFGSDWVIQEEEGRFYETWKAYWREWGFVGDPPDTWSEIRHVSSPLFCQSPPKCSCQNPECRNYGIKGSTKVVALHGNKVADGIRLYGNRFDETTYEFCEVCESILVSTQFT